MPFPLLIPLAMGAGSFLSGMFRQRAANKPQTTTSSNTSTNTSSTMPVLDPAYKSLQDAILPSITKRLSNPQGLPAGYLENGIQNINETYRDVGMGLDNDLTARGLGTSPVAGSVMGSLQRGRATDIAKFRNSADMMARDFENQDLMTALSALNFGRGSSTTSTGSNAGSTTVPGQGGNPIMAGLGELAPMLGWLIGSGAFKGGGGDLGGLRQLGNMNFRF